MSVKSIRNYYQEITPGELSSQNTRDYLGVVATIQDDNVQKKLLSELIRKYVLLEKRVDGLLKNTLPAVVADEIKYKGTFPPRPYDCTILFSDIVGFTKLAEKIPGERLIELLDFFFGEIDSLVAQFRGTKIKTIGDAYMAVFGAPAAYEGHAAMALRTALELIKMINSFGRKHQQPLPVRIGIHTGRVMGGVVGRERMQFDIFGDNVNIASRFESSGEAGKINVSLDTYSITRDLFEFEERGEIALKNKESMKAYFVVKEL